MIDFNELKEKEVIYVKNMQVAEQLCSMFGFANLVGVKDDRYREGYKVYLFKNSPELLEGFRQLIEKVER